MTKEDAGTRTVHPIPPLYNACSRILILGSFPSVASRRDAFFYAHKQNRFWRVIAAVLQEPVPDSVEEKKRLLLSHGIALWDVIGACTVNGSSDSSIGSVLPNDLSQILTAAPVRYIFTNGKTADKYYRRFDLPLYDLPVVCLPSTSPANAAKDTAALIAAWSVIRNAL